MLRAQRLNSINKRSVLIKRYISYPHSVECGWFFWPCGEYEFAVFIVEWLIVEWFSMLIGLGSTMFWLDKCPFMGDNIRRMKKPIRTLALMAAFGLVAAPTAQADRYSDYWAPENMAKRQCTSVHLNYLPTIAAHTAAYTEAVIEKSADGTYFAINCFSSGYLGVQEFIRNGKMMRIAIFSIWDAQDSGDNPHAAPESERAQLIQKGDGVFSDRFGGEGTGGKSMKVINWKEGQVIRTLVTEKMDGADFRQIAGYIYNDDTQQWDLLSCWRIQALKQGLGGSSAFVEDFRRNIASKELERRATFGPAFRYYQGGWYQANQFRFSKDGNPNMEINCRLNAQLGYFSLACGGDIKPEADFPIFATKTINDLPKKENPGADVQDIINAPLLTKKDYSQVPNRLD